MSTAKRVIKTIPASLSYVRTGLVFMRIGMRNATTFMRWSIKPRSVSVAHLLDDTFELHPWGARWCRMAMMPDARVCNHCRSIHPMDLLDTLEGCARWNPSQAHGEMMALIERGEAEESPANLNRWRNVPEGSFALNFIPRDQHSTVIQVAFHGGGGAMINLCHVVDLTEPEWERFEEFLGEVCPEVTIHRDSTDWHYHYHPEMDIMAELPPLTLVAYPFPHLDEDGD